MIKKIIIRDVASYDSEGVVLDDLQKVNFVFGGNGTGKTTLSRVVGSEIPTVEYPGCEVWWEENMAKVYVYNKDFREKNLRESMPGVFTLGDSEMVNDARSIEGMKRSQEEIDRKVLLAHINERKVRRKIEWVEHELQEKLWNEVYKPNRDLRELLKGYHKKASFTERIRNILKGENGENVALNEDYQDIEGIRNRYKEAFVDNHGVTVISIPLKGRMIFEREYLEKDFWLYLAWKSGEMVEKAESKLR